MDPEGVAEEVSSRERLAVEQEDLRPRKKGQAVH